ncbi:hypothetical protein LLE87_29505, partial [Paenibacillus polymyxa]|nr:hypothetical protein [Paenibacillus polymyxa]
MSGPLSPRLLRGGILLIEPSRGAVQRVISLQYNPETLTRSLQPQSVDAGVARVAVFVRKLQLVGRVQLGVQPDRLGRRPLEPQRFARRAAVV